MRREEQLKLPHDQVVMVLIEAPPQLKISFFFYRNAEAIDFRHLYLPLPQLRIVSLAVL